MFQIGMLEEIFNGFAYLFNHLRIKFRITFAITLGRSFNGDLRNPPNLKNPDVIVADFIAPCQQKAAVDIAYFFG